MSVTKRLRFEILSRDGFACVYCGADSTQLHVDHVIPQALGGTDDPSNLATACADCNAGKASTSPSAASVAAVDSKDLEWRAKVADALSQIAAEQRDENALIDAVGCCWDAWTWQDRKGVRHRFDKPSDWRNGVRTMLRRGFTVDSLSQCIAIAMGAHPDDEWTYFCGVVWQTYRRAQEAAGS